MVDSASVAAAAASGVADAAAAAAAAAVAATYPEDAGETHVFVGINALLIVVIISTALWLAHLIKRTNVNFLSDSGAAMLLGVVIGFIINLGGWNTSHHHLLMFEPELFFFIILPPIIFEAGYSMQTASFFFNVGTILLYAVIGTLTSTLVVGYGLFGLAKIGLVGLDSDSPIECLIFGSLISSVDPVAVLSILQQSRLKSPLIYSLIFGESVLNDAVSIVLFNTFRTFHSATSAAAKASGGHAAASSTLVGDFDHFTIGTLFLDFLLVSVGSLWIGILVGLTCSFLFKNSRLSQTPEVEFTLTIFFAYASYCLAEILELSGIMSLFFCSIVLAHYNWHNTSPVSRSTNKYAFKSFALIAETFLFCYLGICAVVSAQNVLHLEWSVMLILATTILCMLARAAHIFPLSFLSNVFSRPTSRRISFRMQIFLWFSSIRGAIAFALSLNVFTPHRSTIVSTTMIIVIITTIVLGGMTGPMLRRLQLVETNGGSANANQPISPDGGISIDLGGSSSPNGSVSVHESPSSSPPAESLADEESVGRFATWWRDFDENHVQEWFGGYAHAKFASNDAAAATAARQRTTRGRRPRAVHASPSEVEFMTSPEHVWHGGHDDEEDDQDHDDPSHAPDTLAHARTGSDRATFPSLEMPTTRVTPTRVKTTRTTDGGFASATASPASAPPAATYKIPPPRR